MNPFNISTSSFQPKLSHVNPFNISTSSFQPKLCHVNPFNISTSSFQPKVGHLNPFNISKSSFQPKLSHVNPFNISTSSFQPKLSHLNPFNISTSSFSNINFKLSYEWANLSSVATKTVFRFLVSLVNLHFAADALQSHHFSLQLDNQKRKLFIIAYFTYRLVPHKRIGAALTLGRCPVRTSTRYGLYWLAVLYFSSRCSGRCDTACRQTIAASLHVFTYFPFTLPCLSTLYNFWSSNSVGKQLEKQL